MLATSHLLIYKICKLQLKSVSLCLEQANTKIMQTMTVTIPQAVLPATFDYSIYLATKLYEDAILSAGQAAKLANLSKRSFIEIMGKYGVSLFSTKVEDVLNDIQNA